MAWTINVAFLLLMLRLSSAANDFKIPLGHIHDHTQMIEHLFRIPMTTFHVAGGTFEYDPLMSHSIYPFKCGEVQVLNSIQDHKVRVKRRFLQENQNYRRNNQKKWHWLPANYDLHATKSSGYNYTNYVKVHAEFSQHRLAGSMYLLLSDYLTCALFYNDHSDDCELWVTKKPVKDKAINVSFCGAFMTTCNNKDVHWYYIDKDCYETW